MLTGTTPTASVDATTATTSAAILTCLYTTVSPYSRRSPPRLRCRLPARRCGAIGRGPTNRAHRDHPGEGGSRLEFAVPDASDDQLRARKRIGYAKNHRSERCQVGYLVRGHLRCRVELQIELP